MAGSLRDKKTMPETIAPAQPVSAWQVIDAMLDGVVITDPHGVIMAVNGAFCAVTGCSRSEVVGRNPSLLHSGRHGRAYYARMWGELRRAGRWQGEIWNRRKNGEIYPEWLTISAIRDSWGHTRCYLGVFRDITNPKRAEERLTSLAQHDPLTGLPNRRLFLDSLKRALDRRGPARRLAVLFLDIDRFKEVNDRWGHPAGDAFLRSVGARLRGCVRRGDLVSRWAGDEFVILLDPVSGRDDVERVARKILGVLRRPFTVFGRRVSTSASVGGCVPDSPISPQRLIARADRAMYTVKNAGRDDFRLWPDRREPNKRRERPSS